MFFYGVGINSVSCTCFTFGFSSVLGKTWALSSGSLPSKIYDTFVFLQHQNSAATQLRWSGSTGVGSGEYAGYL